MTKKERILVYFLLIVMFLIREEIYTFLFQKEIVSKEYVSICNIENKELENKYLELVNAYNYQEPYKYDLEPSKILYRDIYNLKNEITIYKGLNDEIKENNLVINEKGLVGIISKVNKNSSVVELLENENTKLSVKINNSYGILKYKNNELIVEGISNKDDIKESDEIRTSDISIYPSNILIGKVEEIRLNNYDIEKVIKVKTEVDFSNLKFVSIITNLRGES